MKNYESLSCALNDLKKKGYDADFTTETDCLYCSDLDIRLNPDEFHVDEIIHVEGGADPTDNSLIYAISSATGVKGTIKDMAQNPKAASIQKGVKNIVLVHGAFADGSSWAKIIPTLQGKGYNVIAVQNPLTSLDEDVEATKRAIALMDGPVLLVGHSYGGMVISAAGNDPNVAGLLYVCALIPNEGESVVDVVQKFPAAAGSAEFRPDAAGYISLTYKGIHSHFAQDLPKSERDIIYATQTPWATRATTTKIASPAWKTKPSWCIIGTKDEMVTPELARAEAKMINATVLELASSHVPMVSQPAKVAAFIIDSATKL